MIDEVKARRDLIKRLRADMDEMVGIANAGVDECERLRALARALYSSWLEAYYQLDPLWQEKHGHNEELKKYEAPEYAWLTALDNQGGTP